MSGSATSTPLYQSMFVLGSDLARVRVRAAIGVLTDGGLGKKRVKKLENQGIITGYVATVDRSLAESSAFDAGAV